MISIPRHKVANRPILFSDIHSTPESGGNFHLIADLTFPYQSFGKSRQKLRLGTPNDSLTIVDRADTVSQSDEKDFRRNWIHDASASDPQFE
jgi:hypothetical protein